MDDQPIDVEDVRITSDWAELSSNAPLVVAVFGILWAQHKGWRYVAVGIVVALLTWTISRFIPSKARRGRIQIDGNSVRIQTRWATRRVRLRTPRVCQRSEQKGLTTLMFATTHGSLRVGVRDAQACERLIEAAHADPESVQEFVLANWAPRPLSHNGWLFALVWVGVFALALFIIGIRHFPVAAPGFLVAWIAAFQRSMRVSRVTIGREGLIIHGWRVRRLIRWSDVTDVTAPEKPVKQRWLTQQVPSTKDWVHLRAGTTDLRFWAADPASKPARPTASFEETARLHGVILQYKSAALAREEVARSLLRRGRSLDDWRRGPAQQAVYRSESLTDTDLTAQLEDPSVPAEARLGAALALSSRPEAPALGRVRVIAHNTVDAPLSQALLRVADDTFDETALAEFERGEGGVDAGATRRMSK